MTIDSQNMLASILESLDRIDYIRPGDIPGIPLYMDQLTTFMEEQLKHSKRIPEDKVLTKTMINNYAKNRLLPPPEKKKYSKEHILLLIYIYHFKNFLSISDIQTLLAPLTEKYFSAPGSPDLQSIYTEVFSLEKSQVEALKEDLIARYELSQKTFENVPEDEQSFLQLFSFICLLSFDVYIKKQVIEKLIDLLPEPSRKKKDKKKEAEP